MFLARLFIPGTVYDNLMAQELAWRVAGGSGDGVDTTGANFAKALMRAGLNIGTYRSYPSRIRGGHTYYEVEATNKPAKARKDEYNFLLALGDSFGRKEDEAVYENEEIKPLSENLDELQEGGVIVYDEGIIDIEEVPNFEERVEKNNWHVYPLNLRKIAMEHGKEVMRNTAGIGATAALSEIGTEPFEDVMGEVMEGDILDNNIDVLTSTYEKVKEEFDFKHEVRLPEPKGHDEKQILVSGSHTLAFGALDSGCRFISGYPMTPWSDVFTLMTQMLPKFGGTAEQVEDELSAACMAIGASHAGAKALTGSSGGGFSLMSEALGHAEATETPLVMVEANRGGPSTGLPTKTEQSDLEHVLYTSQGDSGRVVLAPGNLMEAYEQMRQAFNIAYRYNLPVIVLFDKEIATNMRNVPKSFFDRETEPGMEATLKEEEIEEHIRNGLFPRFNHDAEKAVPPRTIPGQKGGLFKTSGNEHNEFGYISEDTINRKKIEDRRLEKLEYIREDLDKYSNQTYHGDPNAKYGLICFGSNKGPVETAIDELNDKEENFKMVKISDIAPFPRNEIEGFIENSEKIFVVENNATAQLRHHIQRELGSFRDKLTSILKYDGEPFTIEEIVDGVESSLDGKVDTNYETIMIQEEIAIA